jgi:hypothetical protein
MDPIDPWLAGKPLRLGYGHSETDTGVADEMRDDGRGHQAHRSPMRPGVGGWEIRLAGDDQVNQEILTLRNELVDRRNRLSERYENLPLNDPRRVAARHIKAIASSSYFARLFLREHMTVPNWWRAVGLGALLEDASLQDELDDFAVWIAVGFVVTPFNLFEAAVRRLMRALRPDTSQDARPFAAVFRTLLAAVSIDWADDPIEFLNFYRLIRNTIHNNGRHYGPRGSATSTWRGTVYAFPQGEALDFMDWPLYIELVRTLGSLNEAIMTSPEVAALRPMD